MTTQVLLLSLLISSVPLSADAIVSANWSACGETKSASYTDPIANNYVVSRICDYGANIAGAASADLENLSVETHAHVNGAKTSLDLSAEAFHSFQVRVPMPGLY